MNVLVVPPDPAWPAQFAAEHAHDMKAYMDGKDAFVKHHEALALRWYASQPRDESPSRTET